MKRIALLVASIAFILCHWCSFASAAAPRTGLIGEWLLEGNANDTSGNGNNGTVIGATITSDRFQRPKAAYLFNGTNARINANLPGINVTEGAQVTVCLWMYKTGTNPNGPMVFGFNAYDLSLGNEEGIGFNTYNADWYAASVPNLMNRWIHVAAVFTNGDVTNNKLYVNGVPQTLTHKGSGGPVSRTVSESVSIGSSNNDDAYGFPGRIDEVRVYNRALSAAEVLAVYNDKVPVISAATVTPNAGSAPLAANFFCRAKSPNGPITKYMWDVNGDGVLDRITGTGTLSYTYTSNGVYKARVKAFDGAGYWALSNYNDLLVKVGNGAELAGKVEYYKFDETTKTVNIKTRVYNRGNAAAGPFKVNFMISDNGIGVQTFDTESLAGLAAGANTLLSVSHTFAESIYGRLLSIVIDNGKTVTEVDETNNTFKLFVGPDGR